MIQIDSPTLTHIAQSSVNNGNVEVVLDDVSGRYHYLMSEQKYWERGMIPNISKPIVSIPADLFFKVMDGKIYDKTQQEDISAKIREVICGNDMTQVAA